MEMIYHSFQLEQNNMHIVLGRTIMNTKYRTPVFHHSYQPFFFFQIETCCIKDKPNKWYSRLRIFLYFILFNFLIGIITLVSENFNSIFLYEFKNKYQNWICWKLESRTFNRFFTDNLVNNRNFQIKTLRV